MNEQPQASLEPTELDKAVEATERIKKQYPLSWGVYLGQYFVEQLLLAAKRVRDLEKELVIQKEHTADFQERYGNEFAARQSQLSQLTIKCQNHAERITMVSAAYKEALEALNESKISILDLVRYFDTLDTTRAALSQNVAIIEAVLTTPLAIELMKETK